MSKPRCPDASFTDDLEGVLLRFEAAWSGAAAPDLASFRAANGDARFLLELAHIDVERRVRAGLPVDVAGYLDVLPELREYPEIAAELAETEAELRRRFSERLGAAGASASRDGTSELTFATDLRALTPHAQGGLGEVFVAVDPQLRRRVAVKMLQDRWIHDRRALQDFVAEASITSQLEHPGIVPVHGVGTSSAGRPYYTMRFVEGQTLREAIRAHHATAWPNDEARNLALRGLLTRFVAVCNTIAYAHSRGVLHRDLKPGNILLGKFGETLVLDWGLGKAATTDGDAVDEAAGLSVPEPRHATIHGEVRGTPAYLSPEQANGRWDEVGPATDVFGLGATLYDLLANQAPYHAADATATLEQARRCDPAPLRQRERRLPRELAEICRKAMAATPAARYGSALDLARDVECWLAGEPVSVWRESWPRRARRWVSRRRTLVAVLSVLAVVLPLAAIVGSWFVAQEQAQARLDRQTAQVKEAAAAQITNYLVQVFQAADPVGLELTDFHVGGERAEKTTLLRMLERGDSLVREHLHDQPLARAGLLNAMGNTYCNLGAYDQAGALLAEGRHLRERHLGADHEDTMDSQLGLARLHFQCGEYDKAERAFRLIRDWRRQAFGADDPRTLKAQFWLAFALMYRPLSIPVNNDNELVEADQLLREVLRAQERDLRPDHPDLGHTLLLLAGVKIMQPGGNAAAAAYTLRAVNVFGGRDRATSFGALTLLYLEAERERDRHRYADAERKYLQLLEMLRRQFGERHPIVGLYLGNLAGLYRKMDNVPAGEKAAREAFAIILPTPMRNAPLVVDALLQFADHVKKRDDAEALQLYRQALGYAKERPHVNQANIANLEARIAELGNVVSRKTQ